jgi:WD40 repeat protein
VEQYVYIFDILRCLYANVSILVRKIRGTNLQSRVLKAVFQGAKNIIAADYRGQRNRPSRWRQHIQLRISDQEVLHTLSGHTDMVTKLRFSPDGRRLVSASHDGWVKVWSLQGEELRLFQPPGEMLGIGISPDGRTLATVPFDGPITLWDLDTLEKIKDLGGSSATILRC